MPEGSDAQNSAIGFIRNVTAGVPIIMGTPPLACRLHPLEIVLQSNAPMNLIRTVAALAFLLGAQVPLRAQVVTPMEISDPSAQRLEQRYVKALMDLGNQIAAHKFPYPFYFSRVLDVDLEKQKQMDQRSIRFDIHDGQTVLEITGNYYASYSAERMDSYERLKRTFNDVVLPILQAAVPHFPDDTVFTAFAIEVSHHVRQKVMGISSEHAENVTLIIPVLAAQKLVDAKTDEQRQAAILEAKVYLNAQPSELWLMEGAPTEEWKESNASRLALKNQTVQVASISPNVAVPDTPSVAPNLMKPAAPMRILTPEALSKLQRQNDDAISRMTRDLDKQAHFLPYAPPVFVGFRQGAYLQLSIKTTLTAAAGSSRYKLAALAFDEHVALLARPVLNYFPENPDFDGIDFSSMVQVVDGSSPVAVEFFFPFRMMRCFASYDCTGQQLLDSGTILINGERSALDLQVAEGKN
jgi:hypothetical protein